MTSTGQQISVKKYLAILIDEAYGAHQFVKIELFRYERFEYKLFSVLPGLTREDAETFIEEIESFTVLSGFAPSRIQSPGQDASPVPGSAVVAAVIG